MKHFSFSSLCEYVCKQHLVFGVYIAGDQFDFDSTDWDVFIERVSLQFPLTDGRDIISSVINNNLIMFDREADAWKLFGIMNAPEFYSKQYAIIYGPNGMLAENT